MSGWSDAIGDDVAEARAILNMRRAQGRITPGDWIILTRATHWMEGLRDEVEALRALRDGAPQ